MKGVEKNLFLVSYLPEIQGDIIYLTSMFVGINLPKLTLKKFYFVLGVLELLKIISE